MICLPPKVKLRPLYIALTLALVPLTTLADKEPVVQKAVDDDEFSKWKTMAEQGNAEAQVHIGKMYVTGNGVALNWNEAAKWYRKAAEQGHAHAQYSLGLRYYYGVFVSADSSEAIKWFLKAAEQGDASAQDKLGSMYSRGDGVPKNSAKAVEWYRKAAEHGYAEAQFILGLRYDNGDGILKDELEAYKWYLLSGAQGIESAKKNINNIEARLTASQRAEGRRLAREFNARSTRPSSATNREALGEKARPESSGTGFFITDDGYFITNQHVAGSGATVRLVTASGLIAAKVVKVDKANDLSLLKANGVFSALPVITSSPVRLGAAAFTVGFPNVELQGFSPKLAKGEIAGLAGIQDDARHFQISAPIQPGNSGGALVDERGNVIGVVVARLSQKAALATSGAFAENVNYAVKSSYILSFLESVPEVATKLKEPNTRARKFEDVVTAAEQAAVMVLVY